MVQIMHLTYIFPDRYTVFLEALISAFCPRDLHADFITNDIVSLIVNVSVTTFKERFEQFLLPVLLSS